MLDSVWDDNHKDELLGLEVATLQSNLAEYGIDLNEAWHAAMQGGAVIDGIYKFLGFSRVSLVLCLQDMRDGVAPWIAQSAHRERVTTAATSLRGVGQK